MGGFMEYLYTWLVEQGMISEDNVTVEDITAEFVYGETDCIEDDVRDAWNSYAAECYEAGDEPINDVDGFEP